ncbi:AAA family ATPase [Streptomyces sp. NPDC050997]|uniref:AAA family ATPase n=1 Tax=Streptomyces sp. NPDC050997 TaxID=3155519 RepID=UPI003426DA48
MATPPFFGTKREGFELGGFVQVTLRKREDRISYAVNLGTPTIRGESTPEVYPDIHNTFEVPSEISMFFQESRRQDIMEFREGDDWIQSRKDLDALRDILGVTYEEVVYHPVRVENGAPIFPYVRARRGDRWIDSFSMSYGELSVHRMRWFVRHPYDNSLVILDEPEASIAPRGHAPLVDDLARLARASQVQVIAVTHSPVFIIRVPLDFVRICVRGNETPLLLQPSRISDLRDTLGVESPLRGIVFVEDEAARELLKLMLSTHGFIGGNEVELIDVGSWNDVLIAANATSNSRRLRAVAVIDGDQRGKLEGKGAGRYALFLPGTEPPEQVIMKKAVMQPRELAEALGCTQTSINVYLAELAGLDHHRWLEVLARRTGNDWQYCLRVAFSIWHRDPANHAEVESLVREIEKRVY